jgi:hypothetical protein
MGATSSHEMSHASCLNLKMYIEAMHVPWQRARNLFVDVHCLFESSKETPNFSKNASKLFRIGN